MQGVESCKGLAIFKEGREDCGCSGLERGVGQEDCQEMWSERKTMLNTVKYHAKVFVFYPESNGETVELFKSEIIYLGHTNFENKIFRYWDKPNKINNPSSWYRITQERDHFTTYYLCHLG